MLQLHDFGIYYTKFCSTGDVSWGCSTSGTFRGRSNYSDMHVFLVSVTVFLHIFTFALT